jgi:hypothetical protein
MSTIGIKRIEIDKSQVIAEAAGEVFGMVLRVPFGPLKPTLFSNVETFIDAFSNNGKPDPAFRDYYEAQIVLTQAPILACRPQNDALFGGVYIEDENSATPLTEGVGTGIADPDNMVFPDDDKQAAILGANPSAENNNFSLKVVASKSQVANTFNIELYEDSVLIQDFNVSLLETQLDGFGNSVYIENVLAGRTDIRVVVNSAADLTAAPAIDTTAVAFDGGVTITAYDVASMTASWNQFKEYKKYYTHYLVDTSGLSAVAKAVLAVADFNFFQMVYTAAPSIKSTNKNSTESLSTWKTAMDTYRDTSGTELNVNSDHISLCANWMRINDTSNSTTVWVSAACAFAARKAFTMNQISISQAAVGANANRGSVQEAIELEQDPTSIVNALRDNQINCLTYSPAGIVCWNETTMQVAFTNTSFVSHRTFFYILEEGIENALFFYVFTDISDDERASLESFVRSYTDPFIGEHAEDIQVRVPKDDALAAQRKMKIRVAVIPYPKANEIVFEFIHSKAGVDLSELI